MEEDREETGQLQPVGGGEGLGAEAASAGFAGKPLDTMGRGQSPEEANLLVGPGSVGKVVIDAIRVGTEGWRPGS